MFRFSILDGNFGSIFPGIIFFLEDLGGEKRVVSN